MKKNADSMWLDYFYQEQAEQFVFMKIPMILISDERFNGISSDAKILYGLLLDLVSLSTRNGWVDEHGRVYIIFTLESIQRTLHCADKKATKLLTELEKVGLIERCKHGQGKPALIYVKNFIPLSKERLKTREKHDSGIVKITGQESSELRGNHNNNNHTEYNQTNLILSGGCDSDLREQYREYLRERLDMNSLMKRYPHREETLVGIEDIIIDTVCTDRRQIRVMGQNMPAGVVKAQFMKLDSGHIAYVMDRLLETTSKIRNIRQYLIAALYNAPSTIDCYYQQEVQHDMAHPSEE